MGSRFDADGQLDPRSLAYLAARPKAERYPLGQFLTPRLIRDALLDQVKLVPGMKVLDPGVGTGEFLKSCLEREPDLALTGWDIDPQVLAVARELVPAARLECRSALEAVAAPELFADDPAEERFDLVIGNPPYFEMRGMSQQDRRRFADVISGRPNIFALFFKIGLDVLRPGGLLAYVVPPSMNNGAYFDALRTYITEVANVEYLHVIHDQTHFIDAQTSVQLITLRKGETESRRYTLDLGELSGSPRSRVIFTEERALLSESFADRRSLWSLGFQVTTGTIVWNTRKPDLRKEPSADAVPILWPHNIQPDRGEIVIDADHRKRPQFIANVKPNLGPAIVVNRITGSVGSGAIRCALVPAGMPYVAENHLNVITTRPGVRPSVPLETIVPLLRQEHIVDVIRRLTGNTQLSATELMYWVPV